MQCTLVKKMEPEKPAPRASALSAFRRSDPKQRKSTLPENGGRFPHGYPIRSAYGGIENREKQEQMLDADLLLL